MELLLLELWEIAFGHFKLFSVIKWLIVLLSQRAAH